MSGFTGKSETFLSTSLTNDGFFPSISLGDFQRNYRVPAEYTTDLVERHTKLAMFDVNRALEAKKALWIAEGFTTFESAFEKNAFDKDEKLEQYRRAVFCKAMGLLVRAFTTLNRRQEAENLAKESPDVSGDYFAQSLHAIRRIKGIAENITAELL